MEKWQTFYGSTLTVFHNVWLVVMSVCRRVRCLERVMSYNNVCMYFGLVTIKLFVWLVVCLSMCVRVHVYKT